METLINFHDFQNEFNNSIEKNELKSFIEQLYKLILDNKNVYFAYLFLARSYKQINEIEKAKLAYKKVLSLANPSTRLKIVNEIDLFCIECNVPQTYFLQSESSRSDIKSKTVSSTTTRGNENTLTSKSNSENTNNHQLLKEANKLSLKGNLDDAIIIYERLYATGFSNESVVQGYVAALQRTKNYPKAFDVLKSQINSTRDKEVLSRYLLLYAQLCSAFDRNEEAEETYIKLIDLNKTRNYSNKMNNLSHLLGELARIKLQNNNTIDSIIEVAEESLQFNPQNNIVRKLILALKDQRTRLPEGELTDDFDIEWEGDIDYVSPMLKLDIDSFNFKDDEIVKSGLDPTPIIASRLLMHAKKTENYIDFLEAAKAFSLLKSGSFNPEDFYISLARYAFLKGNMLFNKFQVLATNKSSEIEMIQRIKDSACSYYIESINLQSLVSADNVMPTLFSHLKLQLVYTMIKLNLEWQAIPMDSFSSALKYCLNNKYDEIQKIAFETILACGAASIPVWVSLIYMPGGTRFFYYEMRFENKRLQIYKKFNKLETIDYTKDTKPKDFLRDVFLKRKEKIDSLIRIGEEFLEIDFDSRNINDIKDKWESLRKYLDLYNDTDREIFTQISIIIDIYEPYLFRQSEERTNILYKVRTTIQSMLTFITQNTTFWGRVMFYPMLIKWRNDIEIIESKRVNETIPKLVASIEPNFIQLDKEDYYINLLIKNIGVSTAESFEINIELNDLDGMVESIGEKHYNEEIPVNEIRSVIIGIPSGYVTNHKAIDLNVIVTPYYQEKALDPQSFLFTPEIETISTLQLDDLPWNEDEIPQKHLFKGRDKLMTTLFKHYISSKRSKTYILYGLTRTGKSSILNYLSEKLDLEEIKTSKGRQLKIVTFDWPLNKASAQTDSKDMWAYLIKTQSIEKLKKLIRDDKLSMEVIPDVADSSKARFKDWEILIDHLEKNNIYPMFFMDEFSYYKSLVDKKRIDSSFLSLIRQFALEGKASFILAGTYDIKELIRDPDYGITGQLVNTIEEKVSNIKPEYAREIIEVINDKLIFTEDAIKHIYFLTNCVPYFIQSICLNCGYYAVEKKKKYIGFPEVETVVKILIGETLPDSDSQIKKLTAGYFHNNQYNPQDQREIHALLTTICNVNKERVTPRGVNYGELQKIWAENGILSFVSKLADSIAYLKEKEILIESVDDGEIVYRIGVDLFRRWWENEYPNFGLEIDKLKNN